MLIIGINTAHKYASCSSKYFCSSQITFLNHRIISIDDLFVCIGKLSHCSIFGKEKFESSLRFKMIEVCCRVWKGWWHWKYGSENSLYVQIWNIFSAWCHLNIYLFSYSWQLADLHLRQKYSQKYLNSAKKNNIILYYLYKTLKKDFCF